MATLDFEIQADNTDQIKNLAKEAVERALEAVGLLAEGYAKKLCPVDTGRLRNSITHGVDYSDTTAYIGTNVEYAAYVEFGTSKTAAQPYLEPAVLDNLDEYGEVFEEYLKNA